MDAAPDRAAHGQAHAERFDFVVVGSGVAGLTAAVTAALAGARVLVVEHLETIGGTSARSSGTVWVPGSHLLGEAADEDARRAGTYLATLVGNRGEARMWRTFLDAAPKMMRDLTERADLAFRPFMSAPDYRQDIEGAASGGRPLEPLAFDGRRLGADFGRLAPPLPELTVFGGMMVTRGEAADLLRADRSPRGAWLGARLTARYLADRLSHPRGTRLVLGNALVARLLATATHHGVRVWTGAKPTALRQDGDRVAGLDVTHEGRVRPVNAARGVVLAGGGFPANGDWRAAHLPSPTATHTPASPGADGSSLSLGLSAGGALGPDGEENALWFPSSLATRADGSTAVWPHIVLDRAKPGLVAVGSDGRRFVNEALSYHEFVRAMYRARERAIPAWLVVDRAFIARYGLGLIRPRTPSVKRHVRSGYLIEGASVAELAARIGVPADALEATVAEANAAAANGVDDAFAKGETVYERAGGDPAVRPNPCLGPIATAPFYAVKVVPTPLGTSRGLDADAHARVLDADGAPIEGLYVCGNDMHSAFGGEYPGAGAQLGQGMTFGWLAARHAMGLSQEDVRMSVKGSG